MAYCVFGRYCFILLFSRRFSDTYHSCSVVQADLLYIKMKPLKINGINPGMETTESYAGIGILRVIAVIEIDPGEIYICQIQPDRICMFIVLAHRVSQFAQNEYGFILPYPPGNIRYGYNRYGISLMCGIKRFEYRRKITQIQQQIIAGNI